MRATTFLLIVALVGATLSTASAVRGERSSDTPPQLYLYRTTIEAGMARRIASTALGSAVDSSYAIIQFRGPITTGDRSALLRTGVALLEYLPDFAYVVRGDATQLAAAASLPEVYARLPFTNADKLAPALLRALARGDTAVGQLRIIGWSGDTGALQRDMRAAAIDSAAPTSAATLIQIASLP